VATAVNVFEQQAAGYDRYVREHWNELEQWEKEQHAIFSTWATDRNVVGRFVQSPAERWADLRLRTPVQAAKGKRGTLRTVSLSYALILTACFFFPVAFASSAIALGFINIFRRSWDHGLIQIALACAVIASFVYGISLTSLVQPYVDNISDFSVPYLRSLIASIR
jgi:hypothetical protein